MLRRFLNGLHRVGSNDGRPVEVPITDVPLVGRLQTPIASELEQKDTRSPKTPIQWHGNRNTSLRTSFVVGLLILSTSGCQPSRTDRPASPTGTSDFLERVTEKGPIKLVVRVRPVEPRLSDLVETEIEVTAKAGVEIKPPVFGQAVGDFVVRDYTERTDKTSPKSVETSSRRFEYKLEPMSAGRHLIRSIAIDFVDDRPDSEQRGEMGVIESEPFEVTVTSELGNQVPNLADLTPMFDPRPLSDSSNRLWWILAVIVGLVATAIVWLRRKRTVRTIEPRRKTPQEIAHEAFAALLAEGLPSRGQFKEFYLRLTGIVRHFIEGTTGIHAPEQTTEEFLRAMKSRNVFPIERSQRLQEFLQAADMVKFAGQQPDEEQIEASITRAREFVDFSGAMPASVGSAALSEPFVTN